MTGKIHLFYVASTNCIFLFSCTSFFSYELILQSQAYYSLNIYPSFHDRVGWSCRRTCSFTFFMCIYFSFLPLSHVEPSRAVVAWLYSASDRQTLWLFNCLGVTTQPRVSINRNNLIFSMI